MRKVPSLIRAHHHIKGGNNMEQSEILNSWITVLGNFGFPVAITIYLLIRFEKKIDSLQQAIQSLVELIKTINKKE